MTLYILSILCTTEPHPQPCNSCLDPEELHLFTQYGATPPSEILSRNKNVTAAGDIGSLV
jgi:hypothetical protein